MAQRADVTLRPNALGNDIVLTPHGPRWQDVILTARTGSDVYNTLSYSLITFPAAPGGGTPYTLNLSDTVTMGDVFDRTLVWLRSLTDTATSSDAAAKTVGKPQSDTVTPSDNPAKTAGKPQADTVTTFDSPVKGFGKVSADTVTMSDLVGKTFSKVTSDTITFTDTITGKSVALTLEDVVTILDESGLPPVQPIPPDTLDALEAFRMMARNRRPRRIYNTPRRW